MLKVAVLGVAAADRTDRRSPSTGVLAAVAFAAGFEVAGAAGSVVAVVLAHLAVGVLVAAGTPAAVSGRSAPGPGAAQG